MRYLTSLFLKKNIFQISAITTSKRWKKMFKINLLVMSTPRLIPFVALTEPAAYKKLLPRISVAVLGEFI